MNKIDIEKYIPLYEEKKISVRKIAIEQDTNTVTVNKMINKYYENQGKPRPDLRKTISIEKYIPMFEKREISLWEIARREDSSVTTITKKVDEYYESTGKKRPKFKGGRKKVEIDIEKYRKMYEERKITLREIAEEEHTSISIVERRLQEYYEKEEKKSPKFKNEYKEIDIEQYINEFEKGKITVKEISDKEETSIESTKKQIKKYYNKKGKKAPKVGISIELLKYFMTKGMTKEQIRKNAFERNIIIPDEYFERVQEIIDRDEER